MFSANLVIINLLSSLVVYGASLALRLCIFDGILLQQNAIQSQLNHAVV